MSLRMPINVFIKMIMADEFGYTPLRDRNFSDERYFMERQLAGRCVALEGALNELIAAAQEMDFPMDDSEDLESIENLQRIIDIAINTVNHAGHVTEKPQEQ